MDIVNSDFEKLPDEIKLDLTIRKEIMWESDEVTEKELSKTEAEYIREFQSNNPKIYYNQWPK